MAEVVVFHHAQGLTDGVLAFAGSLRAAGHRATAPDVYDGATFTTLDEGIAHAHAIGFGTILERGRSAAEPVPAEAVYVGFSLGVLPAQLLAQTRPGGRGALLVASCIPPGEFGDWPAGVPFEVHATEGDPIFTGEGDLEAARALVGAHPEAGELILHPGSAHLFADPSVPGYDAALAAELLRRALAFLDAHG